MSEVEKIREMADCFCKGNGIDVGFGGCPVNTTAICLDLPNPYTTPGMPQHLSGDARSLYWFRDNVLDYVFSSHLLEDFPNTKEILIEWIRVLKPGGLLVLYLPNEKKYRETMENIGGGRNPCHQIENMNLPYIKEILLELNMEIEYEFEERDAFHYGFLIVGKK
jgi:predicted SAM-dependent methyltransferase